MLSIVKATFPGFSNVEEHRDCQLLSTEMEELSCKWHRLSRGMEDNLLRAVPYEKWLNNASLGTAQLELRASSQAKGWSYELQDVRLPVDFRHMLIDHSGCSKPRPY